jgi:hypothetical protein
VAVALNDSAAILHLGNDTAAAHLIIFGLSRNSEDLTRLPFTEA